MLFSVLLFLLRYCFPRLQTFDHQGRESLGNTAQTFILLRVYSNISFAKKVGEEKTFYFLLPHKEIYKVVVYALWLNKTDNYRKKISKDIKCSWC